jgi:hypothetical protein
MDSKKLFNGDGEYLKEIFAILIPHSIHYYISILIFSFIYYKSFVDNYT